MPTRRNTLERANALKFSLKVMKQLYIYYIRRNISVSPKRLVFLCFVLLYFLLCCCYFVLFCFFVIVVLLLCDNVAFLILLFFILFYR